MKFQCFAAASVPGIRCKASIRASAAPSTAPSIFPPKATKGSALAQLGLEQREFSPTRSWECSEHGDFSATLGDLSRFDNDLSKKNGEHRFFVECEGSSQRVFPHLAFFVLRMIRIDHQTFFVSSVEV